MPFLNKFLILLIIVLTVLGLFYLFFQRQQILNRLRTQEGMTTAAADKTQQKVNDNYVKLEMSSVVIQTPTTISNVNPIVANLPLNQVCIKSSYNSACSGKYISIDMIQYLLSRGCRYLDFELYLLNSSGDNSSEKDLYVGVAQDSNATAPTSYNTVLFTTVLANTIASAFSMQTGKTYATTNPNDPLFIQLRLKTDNESKQDMFTAIRKDIQRVSTAGYSRYIGNDLGSFIVDSDYPIAAFLNKVVFVFQEEENYIAFPDDDPSSSVSSSYPTKKSKASRHISGSSTNPAEFYPFIYMLSNTTDFRIYYYKELLDNGRINNPPNENTPYTTNVNELRVVVPTPNAGAEDNPSIYSSIGNQGVQITTYQYYKPSYSLFTHEKIFDTYKASFIPMTQCLNYIRNYPEIQNTNAAGVLM